jgi:hypothetical protein
MSEESATDDLVERWRQTNEAFAVHGVLADDERAVILAGGEVGHGGETFRWGTVGIFRVTGGKIAERWVIPHDQHAFDEIWSS